MRVTVPLPFDVSNLAQGRNLRVVHLLRRLNGQCDLTCVAPGERLADGARRVLPGVRIATAHDDYISVTVNGSYQVRRALAFFGYDGHLAAEMARWGATADVVLGFDVPSVAYLLAVSSQARRVRGSRPRTVCDLIDDPWLTWKSLPLVERCSRAGVKTALCARVMRSQVLGVFDALTAVAPGDAEVLSRAAGMAVTVVPNGVEVPADADGRDEREPMVVFTGTMHFPPNEAAACYLARRIWPRVLRLLSEYGRSGPAASVCERSARLAIVGADPTPSVRALADEPGVTVTGRVDDVSTWLRRARVAVAPMVSGCGMKNKVLEACAAACPVVATRLGAAGLPAGAANGILVAETTDGIAREVARLLTDDATSREMGAAGRALVRERLSWERSAAVLMEVLRGQTATEGSTTDTPKPGSRKQASTDSATGPAPTHNEEALIHADS